MFIGLYVKYSYSCQILMKLEFSRQLSAGEGGTNIKFHPMFIGPCIIVTVKE